MPNRILRDWTDSFKFDGISAEAERLFTRLIMKADDFGRYNAHPQLIKSGCFPLVDDLRTHTISAWLAELHDRKLVCCYKSHDRPLLAIINFGQRIRDDSKPRFEAPDGKPEKWLPTDSAASRRIPPQDSALFVVGDGDGDGGAVGRSARVLEALQGKIGELYKRPKSDVWTYAELSTLAEVARRPEALAEFDHITAFRRSMQPDDRRRFFPQSVMALVSRWTEALDKARVQCPIERAKP